MKQQHYIAIIILLVILNVFSWRFWWEKPNLDERIKDRVERYRGKSDKDDKQGLRFLIDQLDLSDTQKQTFKDLRIEHFKQMKENDLLLHDIRAKLALSLKENDLDSQQALLDEMAKVKTRMEYEMLNHLSSMRKLCTAEQQVQFDSIFYKLVIHNPYGPSSPRKDRDGKGKGQRRGHQESR